MRDEEEEEDTDYQRSLEEREKEIFVSLFLSSTNPPSAEHRPAKLKKKEKR